MVLHAGKCKPGGLCVKTWVLRVLCCAPVAEGRPCLCRQAVVVQGCPRDTLPLYLMVLLGFPPRMRLRALVGQF